MNSLLYRFLLLFCFLSLGSFSLEGQTSRLDSLEHLLTQKIEDTTRTKTLLQLGEIFYQKHYPTSINYCHKALQIALKNNTPKYLSHAYELLSLNHIKLGLHVDSMLFYNQKELECAKILKDKKIEAATFEILGLIYQKNNHHEKAVAAYLKALRVSQEAKNSKMIAQSLNSIGNAFYSQSNYKKAKQYFIQSFNIATAIDDVYMIGANTSNLGDIYSIEHQLDSALLFYNQALELSRKLHLKNATAKLLISLSKLYHQHQQYILAQKYALESLEIYTDLNSIIGQSIALTELGLHTLELKEYQKALTFGTKALELIEKTNDTQNKQAIYQLLHKTYEATQQYELAYQHLLKYQTLNDSIFNKDKTKIINEIETKYQLQQKETENKLLKAEQKNYQKNIQNRNISIIAALLGLLFLTTLVGINYRSKVQTKKYNELLEKTVQERTKELEQANYELRTFNYIASHDIKEPIRNVGSYVSLIQRKLPDDLQQHFSDYFETIAFSIRQLYTLLEDFAKYLSLSKGEKIELEQVNLNQIVDNVTYGLSTTIKAHNGQVLSENLPTIPSNGSLLFSLLKNLIENGLKYNQSETPIVRVGYQKNATHHQIIVSDNGIGIAPEYHEKIFEMFKRLHRRDEYEGSGIGLAIVKLVVSKLNGSVTIESEINKGSIFTLSFPL